MGFIIQGSNFGSSQGSSTVTINGDPLTVVSGGWSNTGTSITVQVPAGTAPGAKSLVVTVPGSSPSSPVTFTVTGAFGCSI
jgi:hypothetical protein